MFCYGFDICMTKTALVVAFVGLSVLVGCQTPGDVGDPLVEPAALAPVLDTTNQVESLPRPARAVDVAVYGFPDRTGQNKQEDGYSSFSRAVTQGSDAILVDVLSKTGQGDWFNVVERAGLNNLLQERNIIEQTRERYGSGRELPPLVFAGLLIEGGVITYDSNETTGGAGANFLGIGPEVRYRRDYVTVTLRAVSVETGEVLASITTAKTVYSALVRGQHFKFVAVDELLEVEAGFSRNEPSGLAVRQAIELGVYALVLEGAQKGLWSFADRDAQESLLRTYNERYYGIRSDEFDVVYAN